MGATDMKSYSGASPAMTNNGYGALARWYDALTSDIPYGAFADFYERVFLERGLDARTLLDFCCGTGSLTWLMAERGYETIGVDASADMLAMAASKSGKVSVPPLFLCQNVLQLDLYGTVDAALCCLDGMNHIAPADLPGALRRLRLFVRPGGLLLFDVLSPERLRSLDGRVSVDERPGLLCLWRADFDAAREALVYGLDIFSGSGGMWRREQEEHTEYAHDPGALLTLLQGAGFSSPEVRPDGPQGDSGRLFIVSERI